MSSANTASGLLSNIEHAQKDLALYAAIIGHKPMVGATIEEVAESHIEEVAATEAVVEADNEIDDHAPRRISLWMRHVRHEAKKRIHEAKMRLAS